MLLYLVKNPQGISPEQLRLQLEATRKEYYTSIGELRRTDILLKRPPNKYYLSTFGRVLYKNALVNIQKSLDVFWMIHSIDVLSSQDEVRKLLDDHNYRELLKTLIPNKEIRQTIFEELRKTMNDLEDGDFTIAGGTAYISRRRLKSNLKWNILGK